MKIVFPKEIIVLNSRYKVIQDKESSAGSFDGGKCELIIGTKYLKDDPDYTFMVICHEIQEICNVALCLRYNDTSVEGNYKFFMDHKEFSNSVSLFAQTIKKFIK